jgi:hypothetical protein
LPLHERRIVLPGFKEGLLVGLVERDEVRQDDRISVDGELTFDREVGV